MSLPALTGTLKGLSEGLSSLLPQKPQSNRRELTGELIRNSPNLDLPALPEDEPSKSSTSREDRERTINESVRSADEALRGRRGAR